jgi:hypothetical protein
MLEWEYDRSFWQNTIIMDFNLVCEVSNVAQNPLKKLGSKEKRLKIYLGTM